MNGPLEEQMGSMMVCDKVCLGVGSTNFWFLSCDKSQFSLVEKLPGKGLVTTEFLWRICLQADKSSSGKSFPCICCLASKGPQLKVINIPKCHTWELHVLHLSHASQFSQMFPAAFLQDTVLLNFQVFANLMGNIFASVRY